jgi:membrane-associated phospholipid phosphatase
MPTPSLLRQQVTSVPLLGALFGIVYGFCNWVASTHAHLPSFLFPWERSILFMPWMVVPYISIDLLFVGAPFLCRDTGDLRILKRRIEWCILISAIFFLLLPLRMAFTRPETDGVPGFLFDLLAFDMPFNLFPSLHVSLALVLWRTYRRRARGFARLLVDPWFLAIALSTLFVWQHHIIDLVGGAAVGLTAVLLFPSGDALSRPGTNARLGLRYLALAVSLVALIALWPPAAWLLAWPALSLLVVSSAYLYFGADVIGKGRDGHAHLSIIVLGPWLLACRIAHRHLSRGHPERDEIREGVWIGRPPTDKLESGPDGPRLGAVLDLAAECSPHPRPREIVYLPLPLLDLTAPDAEELRRAVRFVEEHRRRGVLVHCALGFSRSATVAAAWLLSRDPSLDVDGAVDEVSRRRRDVRITDEMRKALVGFARSRPAAALLLED